MINPYRQTVVPSARSRRAREDFRRALGGEVAGKTVALLVLAFKPNTDDVRESPALAVARALATAGCRVRAFDPVALGTGRAAGFEGEACADEYDACSGADALVIATEWNQFRNLDLERIKAALKAPVLLDLRNVYEPGDMAQKGFHYVAVGR